MSPEEIGQLRTSAEMAQLKPYMDVEVASMQKAVVNSVMMAINSGTLTPEMAMSKWMEYVAYQRMSIRYAKKAMPGNVDAELNFPPNT